MTAIATSRCIAVAVLIYIIGPCRASPTSFRERASLHLGLPLRTNHDRARWPTMARYFFHLHDRGELVPDEEGRDLPSIEAAIRRATMEARGILAAEVSQGKLCLGCHIEVEEESTGRVFIVPFSATVQLESPITEKLKRKSQ